MRASTTFAVAIAWSADKQASQSDTLGFYPLELAAPGSFCLEAEVPEGADGVRRPVTSWLSDERTAHAIASELNPLPGVALGQLEVRCDFRVGHALAKTHDEGNPQCFWKLLHLLPHPANTLVSQ
jgi:hypothetical protein